MGHDEYAVIWSVEDQEYVATCPRFPSLSWLNGNPVHALMGLIDAIKVIDQEMPNEDC